MATPQGRERDRVSRQRPVACTFCRTRKLRCNRSFPCSSCSSRGLLCQPGYSNTSSDQNSQDALVAQNSAILARLARLESIVLSDSLSNKAHKTSPDQCSVPTATSPPKRNAHEHEVEDPSIDQLEILYAAEYPTVYFILPSLLAEDIICDICPLQELKQQTPSVRQSDTRCNGLEAVHTHVTIPTKTEAMSLLSMYFNTTTYMFHIIHIPSVESLVAHIYDGLISRHTHDPRHLALLTSILANTAHMWTARHIKTGLFTTIEEAQKQAISWAKSTLDLIQRCCRTLPPTVELIQATITTGFLMFTLEGISTHCRYLVSTAITLAREMGFHRIDKPSSKIPNRLSVVEAETGRRIWWYLAATDWQLAGIGGPQEGIYSINPKHMMVNLPLHIDDYSLRNDNALTELPRSQPCTMSYFLERVRLAELCREVIDYIPFSSYDIEDISYERIIGIDNKFKSFLEELPPFFVLGSSEKDNVPAKDTVGITIQRYVINSLASTRRCKLHLPFLRRHSPGSDYSYSRHACFEASKHIIRAERLLEDEDISFTSSRMRLSGTLHTIFMACTVLTVDLCFHRVAGDDDERVIELREACQILEHERSASAAVDRFLRSLMDVLRRHDVSLPVDCRPRQALPSKRGAKASNESNEGAETSTEDNIFPHDSVFDELCRTFMGEIDFETLDWNDILTELDSQIM